MTLEDKEEIRRVMRGTVLWDWDPYATELGDIENDLYAAPWMDDYDEHEMLEILREAYPAPEWKAWTDWATSKKPVQIDDPEILELIKRGLRRQHERHGLVNPGRLRQEFAERSYGMGLVKR